jgi:hypothetical protein
MHKIVERLGPDGSRRQTADPRDKMLRRNHDSVFERRRTDDPVLGAQYGFPRALEQADPAAMQPHVRACIRSRP